MNFINTFPMPFLGKSNSKNGSVHGKYGLLRNKIPIGLIWPRGGFNNGFLPPQEWQKKRSSKATSFQEWQKKRSGKATSFQEWPKKKIKQSNKPSGMIQEKRFDNKISWKKVRDHWLKRVKPLKRNHGIAYLNKQKRRTNVRRLVSIELENLCCVDSETSSE